MDAALDTVLGVSSMFPKSFCHSKRERRIEPLLPLLEVPFGGRGGVVSGAPAGDRTFTASASKLLLLEDSIQSAKPSQRNLVILGRVNSLNSERTRSLKLSSAIGSL